MKYQILFGNNSISFQGPEGIADPEKMLCNGRIEMTEEIEEYHGMVFHDRDFYFIPDEN